MDLNPLDWLRQGASAVSHGLFGSGAPASAAPAAPPSAAPSGGSVNPYLDGDPSAAPAQATTTGGIPTPQGFQLGRPNLLGVASNILLRGMDPETAYSYEQMRPLQRAYQLYQMNMGMARARQTYDFAQSLSPQEREAFYANPAKYGESFSKRLEPQIVKPDENEVVDGSSVFHAPSAPMAVAPNQTFLPSPDKTAPFQAGPGPMVVAPDSSVFNPTTGGYSQAPAAPLKVGGGESVFDPKTGRFATAPQILKTEPGVTATDIPGSAPPAGGVPRGIRNNNPLNVTTPPSGQWNGQTGTDGKFAVFNSPQAGLAAADQNLAAKWSRHGLNTLTGIIADPQFGWDPGNNGYVQTVAKDLGIDPNQPLDLTNPQVRQRLLGSMQKVEIGSSGAAPAPVSPSTPSAPTALVQGRVNTPIPAAQAIQEGLAPGRWEIDPMGHRVLVSPAPKDDATRVDMMMKTADTLDHLYSTQQQFSGLNRNNDTGLQYGELGIGDLEFNPLRVAGEKGYLGKKDVSTMNSLANSETFMVKPPDVGRVLQAEIPMWQHSVQQIDKSKDANDALVQMTDQSRQYIRAKGQFYQDYLYQHGNLYGADQAWQRGGSGSSRPGTPQTYPSTPGPQAPQRPTAVRAAPPPPAGVPQTARQATDGHWYSPDPQRPGKYVRWQ